MRILTPAFFNRTPTIVAQDLLGKIIRVQYKDIWLSAQIIETEAYYKKEKGSHASLGFTLKRKALFMPPGTVYMYYARGGDSLNISCRGPGNAVLIKSAVPYTKDLEEERSAHMIQTMLDLNPSKNIHKPRDPRYLCSGQTLLCKALGLLVKEWDQKQFSRERFYIAEDDYRPKQLIQARRLGIPLGRDEHLLYRWVDNEYAQYATENPLRKRNWEINRDYFLSSRSL